MVFEGATASVARAETLAPYDNCRGPPLVAPFETSDECTRNLGDKIQPLETKKLTPLGTSRAKAQARIRGIIGGSVLLYSRSCGSRGRTLTKDGIRSGHEPGRSFGLSNSGSPPGWLLGP